MKKLFLISATVALAACQSTPQEPLRATAALQPTKGSKAFGEATFEQAGDKVRVIVFAQGLRPGVEHGFHIHEAGDCSSGDGMSTKGHFNPFNKPHGPHTSAERHARRMRRRREVRGEAQHHRLGRLRMGRNHARRQQRRGGAQQ